MLYPTVNQPIVIIAMFFTGLACGLIFEIFRFLTFLSGNDKISKNFFDFLAVIFLFALFFIVNLAVNYGQFRVYVILIFLIGFAVEEIILKILWTKIIEKCYTRIVTKVRTSKAKWKTKRKKD